VFSVAVPLAGVTLPRTFELQLVEPSANATLPPGIPAVDARFAVITTFDPAVVVAGVAGIVVVDDAGLMVTENADEFESVNWAWPWYATTIECAPPPKAFVVSDAVLLFPVPLNVPEPIVEPPSVKLTWPVGAPAALVDTVAESATLLWNVCVVGVALPVVVVAVPIVTFVVVANTYGDVSE
jgi:hypothetical protein